MLLQAKKSAGKKLGSSAPFPKDFAPQLATASIKVPEGDDWIHEVKFDGYRILCEINNGKVRLVSRNGKDWTQRFGSVAAAVKDLNLTSTIIDGELIAVDAKGASSFQKLQQSVKLGKPEDLLYYAFDLPYLEGRDLRSMTLIDRKGLLAELLDRHFPKNDGTIRYSDHFEGSGAEILSKACAHKLEGIVSKRRDSIYENRRSRKWLKSKCQGREEFVIGGFTRPHGARVGFGALLIGRYNADGNLSYCGRVGTGFDNRLLRDLKRRLTDLKADDPPFHNPPIGNDAKEVTWVQPELVGEIEFTEVTEDGMLRHPSFQGLREDKSAKDVRREDAAAKPKTSMSRMKTEKQSTSDATFAGVTLTHPDRVLYPDDGITKLQLAEYYSAAADWILPYVVDRPLTLVRCPGGAGGKCFYQKHRTDSMPEAVDSIPIREKSETEDYVVIRDLAGLISLVQMSVLELHPWNSRTDRVEQPDQVIFDLDPGPDVAWEEVVDASRDVRTLLESFRLESFVRTSGGKGLHIVAPLSRRNSWAEVVEFARNIASGMAARDSDRFVANMRKALRQKKIYIDYLRNQRGATAIANYSTRNRPGTPVAMPIRWEELNSLTGGNEFTIRNAVERLTSIQVDPWTKFRSQRQSITRKAQDSARTFVKSGSDDKRARM